MTELEIILFGIMWVGYGVFALYQTKDSYGDSLLIDVGDGNGGAIFLGIVYILIAPAILAGRAIVGIFKQYKW